MQSAILKIIPMKLNKHIFIFLFLGCFTTINAQSPLQHFSMFNFSPLTMNPAYTGAFQGTLRLGGIYRDQWRSFLPNQFSTPSFYADAPLLLIRKRDWVGAGINLYSDKAGSGHLGNTGFLGSVAYHLAMDKKQKNILTLGVQVGSVQRKLEIGSPNITFEDELKGAGTSPDRSRVGEKASYIDINAGVLLRSKLSKKASMDLGLALTHLTKPKYNLISAISNNKDENLPIGIILNGKMDIDLNKKWTMSPAFIFQTLSGANEIALQTWMAYKMKPEVPMSIRFGSAYRVGDALKILGGIDYKDLRVGVAYDINLSDLTKVTNTVGAFELALQYIIKIYKKPDVKPAFLCPRI
ncbi:MAG TPA: type IX secretion system membrane protein PorP/SprF [Bacteroidetes bacterium]|nr:type IX secretion system membrane protein PorP/SprF [Bacteroidota bacterium]